MHNCSARANGQYKDIASCGSSQQIITAEKNMPEMHARRFALYFVKKCIVEMAGGSFI